MIVLILSLGNEPETVAAFSAVAKVHEEITPTGLAVVEVATGLGVVVEGILELHSSHNLVAKIVLEDLQASIRSFENVILLLQILHLLTTKA